MKHDEVEKIEDAYRLMQLLVAWVIKGRGGGGGIYREER